MACTNAKRSNSDPLHFESVSRISSLPIVESSLDIAGHVYRRIKSSNSLMNWSLDAAEQSLALAAASAKPAIVTLNGPITTIDQLLCRGIDIVEQRVPAVHIPPQQMYWNTREYVTRKIVWPVLMRADSMKQIGSQAACVAVDTLDGALTVADQYVDLYLPGDPADKIADENVANDSVSKTTRTIKHGARFSRKLHKRLTLRTLAEARALKEHGTECIHVFLYVIELIATNPKLALRKAKELWATLSLPEPENQARPATLEQLLVLVTRESARRIVHLVNGATSLAARTPRRIGKLLIRIGRRFLALTDAALKAASIIGQGEPTKTTQMSVAIRSAIRKLGTSTSRLLVRTTRDATRRPSKHARRDYDDDHKYGDDDVDDGDRNRDRDRDRDGDSDRDRDGNGNDDDVDNNDNDNDNVKDKSSARSSSKPQQPHVDDFRNANKRYRVTNQSLETVSYGFRSPSDGKPLYYAPRSTAHGNVAATDAATTIATASSSSSSSSSPSSSASFPRSTTDERS